MGSKKTNGSAEVAIAHLKLTAQLDAWPDSALICDRKGRILFVNRAWRHFASANGYTGPDFIGQNYFAACIEREGVETTDADAVARGLCQVAGGDVPTFTYRYQCHAPHQKRWFKLVVTAQEGQIDERLMVVTHINITDEIMMASESETAARSAMLAHDVRTGLNGMLGYVQLARIQLSQSRDAERQIAALQQAENAGWRINEHLEDIMMQVRAQPGADEAREPPLDVTVVVEAAISALGPVGALQIEIEDALSGQRLHAPSNVLYRILTNLLSNAVKYNQPDGWVRVELRVNRSGGIDIVVADSGVGMDSEMQARAFNRFYRDIAQSANVQGFGLGLAVVKDLVSALDGDVSIDSAPGRGSTFTLRFPAWRTDRSAVAAANS